MSDSGNYRTPLSIYLALLTIITQVTLLVSLPFLGLIGVIVSRYPDSAPRSHFASYPTSPPP